MQRAPFVTGPLSEHCEDDDYGTLEGYRARGGYETAKRVLKRETPEAVVEVVQASGLRARGSAAFATGDGPVFVAADDDAEPRYLVCNAEESEPGSFKDRLLLERAPHLLIEGILIAAFAMRAERTFLYLRGEYGEAARVLERAIEEARAARVLGAKCLGARFAHDVALVRGAGAYVCGEETALLESIEGRKGMPRPRPPGTDPHALFGRPTTVSHVETLCHVPRILERGADWFREQGTEASPGTTLFGVSGHVARPGLYELPLGTPLDEIVFQHAGGVPDGRKLKAVVPGGLGVPVLPAGQVDVPMADEFLRERGTQLGTGGIVVMDDRTCMVRVACVVSRFFRDESCGQCTPCREGTGWTSRIVQRIEAGDGRFEDLAVLEDVCAGLEGRTLCALADSAAGPLRGLLRHFPQDFQSHIGAGCPYPESFSLPAPRLRSAS